MTVPNVTALLRAWSTGDPAALDALAPLVYDELRRQASRALGREAEGHTLQTTELVHETWMRLVDQRPDASGGRVHFFGIAARLIRQVLVDAARARHADKRGGGVAHVTLGAVETEAHDARGNGVDLLALDDALTQLAVIDPMQARVVELRYFAGLSVEETAEALGVSPATVKREWTVARGWLKRALG